MSTLGFLEVVGPINQYHYHFHYHYYITITIPITIIITITIFFTIVLHLSISIVYTSIYFYLLITLSTLAISLSLSLSAFIFFFIKDANIANYADDNTTYTSEINVESLLNKLENETTVVLNLFHINEMKSNDDKCHLIVANTDNVSVALGNDVIETSVTVELLGVKLDKNLNFIEYVSDLLKKANQKLHALARISKYLSHDKLKIIMTTFIKSQFNYCSLIWMFHNRTLNNKINKLHERALRLVYKNEN